MGPQTVIGTYLLCSDPHVRGTATPFSRAPEDQAAWQGWRAGTDLHWPQQTHGSDGAPMQSPRPSCLLLPSLDRFAKFHQPPSGLSPFLCCGGCKSTSASQHSPTSGMTTAKLLTTAVTTGLGKSQLGKSRRCLFSRCFRPCRKQGILLRNLWLICCTCNCSDD